MRRARTPRPHGGGYTHGVVPVSQCYLSGVAQKVSGAAAAGVSVSAARGRHIRSDVWRLYLWDQLVWNELVYDRR